MLLAFSDRVDEVQEPFGQESLDVFLVTKFLNQVAVSLPWQVEHSPDGDIPGLLQLDNLLG